MMYEVEVDFRGRVTVPIEAEDRDDAAFKATEKVEEMGKGALLDEFDVTGTLVQTMSDYDLRELKVTHLI
jgi:hypothetical protein